MKMNGRIAGLVLCGFLALFASSAWGEDCTPVVYAFRHAEDSSAFALNPVGRRHADLYPAMISAFQDTFSPKLCAVAKVYAATIADKPNHERSATNSYYTAKTLASDRMRGACGTSRNGEARAIVGHFLDKPGFAGAGRGNHQRVQPGLRENLLVGSAAKCGLSLHA